MRLKKNCFISLVLMIILSLALATPTMAVPQIPHAFYGTVTVGDGPAPDGVLISAKIGGVEYATTTTLDGKYGYSPTFKVPADDPDTPDIEGGMEGDTIDFYIEGVQVATYTFSNGEVTRLDLEIEELPAPPTPPAGGGGAPPAYYTQTNLFGIEGSFRISNTGEILETITGTSADGNLTVTIPAGTIALDKDGNPLSSLTAAVDPSPPPPPEGTNIIGLAYDFSPAGATFDPPITLEYIYDPAEIPEGVAEEDLVLAYYDEVTGEWVEVPCIVDRVTHHIIATVSHFTTFAIIAHVPPPAPAAFSLSNLTVQPTEVQPKEAVTIAVSVANTGGTEGSYTVVLKINGVKEAEKSVTIAAGGSQIVTFSVTKEDAASYSVTVDGLSGSFTVVAPPAPAAFSVSNLSIQPAEVLTREAVTISAAVANTGGTEGSYTVVLKIDGVKEAEKSVTIAAGASKTVTFSATKEDAASYSVTVDGLSGSFTVVAPAPAINWPVIGGIIGGVIVVALLVFFLVRRRAA